MSITYDCEHCSATVQFHTSTKKSTKIWGAQVSLTGISSSTRWYYPIFLIEIHFDSMLHCGLNFTLSSFIYAAMFIRQHFDKKTFKVWYLAGFNCISWVGFFLSVQLWSFCLWFQKKTVVYRSKRRRYKFVH